MSTIKVDSIQNTAGEPAFVITPEGYIKPAKFAGFAGIGHQSAGWTNYTSFAAYSTLATSECIGDDFNPATGEFTVPVTGLYQVNAAVYTGNGTDQGVVVRTAVNGVLDSRYSAQHKQSSGSDDNSTTLAAVIPLSKDDIFTLQLLGWFYAEHTSFSAYLIG